MGISKAVMRAAVRCGPSVVLPFRRAASAVLVVALFASPVLESLHEAQRVHFACPEDGELIDAPMAPAHQHVRATGDGPFLFAEHDSSPPVSSEGGHDHCAIATQAHMRAREKSHAYVVPPVLQAGTAANVTDDPGRLVSLAIYRFAPKGSPP